MCSGNAFAPRNWNHDLHNLAGCDHDSIQARILDAFLEDFMLAHHYNRRAKDVPRPVETHPLKPFDAGIRRIREDAAKESITLGPAKPLATFNESQLPPVGCHNPVPDNVVVRPLSQEWLGHEQHVPVVDPKAVERVMDFARDQKCAEVKPCDFKFFTRPGYCNGFWLYQHGRKVQHYENEAEANAQRDLLNRVPVPIDLESCLMRPEKFTETDGTDGKTAADCFAKGGIVDLPRTTIGGFPVAPPIDLPPVEVKPRVRGLASIRRSWRVR